MSHQYSTAHNLKTDKNSVQKKTPWYVRALISYAITLPLVYYGGNHIASLQIKKALEQVQRNLQASGRFEFGEVNVDVFRARFDFHNLSFTPHSQQHGFSLDLLRIDEINSRFLLNQVLQRPFEQFQIRFQLDGIKIHRSMLNQQLAEWLQPLGYQDLQLNLGLKISYLEEGQILDIQNLRMDSEDLFDASLQAQFGELPLPTQEEWLRIQNEPEFSSEFSGKYLSGQFHHAQIHLKEKGFISRIKHSFYQKNKMNLSDVLSLYFMSNIAQVRATASMQNAFLQFLKAPGSLTLKSQPIKPLSFNEINANYKFNRSQLLESLKLEASLGD